MAQKVITIILVLLIIGGLAWYFNKNYLQPSPSQTGLPQFKTSSTETEESFSSKLIYSTKGSNTEVWAVTTTKNNQKLFTDADESDKILKLSNLATAAGAVLAVTNADKKANTGKLVSINLSSAKKTELQNNFAKPSLLVTSPDAKKIAFTRFSNVEENYGYSLYTEDIDGQNVKNLARSEKEISLFTFNASGNKIAYVTYDGSNARINTVDLQGEKSPDVVTLENKAIHSLEWKGDLVMSVSNIGSSGRGEIDIIKDGGRTPEKITDYTGGHAYFVSFENPWLGMVISSAESSDKVDMGQIYLKNVSGKTISLQKGSQILGWLE